MIVYRSINVNQGLVLALGYFDGVHLGHKKLIETAVNAANQRDTKSAVITFSQNPANYFSNEKIPNIQIFKDKELSIEALGIDFLYELEFQDFCNMTPEEYIEQVLIKYFKPKAIIVGYNHNFGKNALGTPQLLREKSKEYNYELIEIPEQKIDNNTISSTQIREYITQGNLQKCKQLLGRSFSVRNSVVNGNKIARNFNVPTANLVWSNSIAKLPYGVYFGYAYCDEKIYPSLISWGKRPTLTEGKEEVLEVHLNNFGGNLYGKIIKVVFETKLRNEINFATLPALSAQIKSDYNAFQEWVNALKIKF